MRNLVLRIVRWIVQFATLALVRLGLKKNRLPNGHPELVRRIRVLLGSTLLVKEIVPKLDFLAEATSEEFETYSNSLKTYKRG